MDPALKLEVEAFSRQKSIREAIASGDSEVQRFYSGRTVFLTGGSGFLGKLIVEKLIRSCKPARIFLLLREKKGKRIQERLDSLLQDSVFDGIKQQQPDFATRITAVAGDVAELNLGLSDEDWQTLTEQVDLIFHVAAVTKFDEALRLATLINVRGTRECLKLGKACKKLRSYVHVSTAYSHTTQKLLEKQEKVEEVFYKSPIPSETLIQLAETIEEDRLRNITKELIKDWPNTYTFTKAVSEHMVQTQSEGLPICIIRPGVVLSAYSEPLPGWMDASSIYGASGLIVGLGLGLLHVIMLNTKAKQGIIPCDLANNAILAASKETAEQQNKGGEHTKIYTLTTVNRNHVRWYTLRKILETKGRYIISNVALYYVFGFETTNKLMFLIFSWLWLILPAYFADFVCLLIGKERRFAKLAQKVYTMSSVLSFFMLNEFEFDDGNAEKLYNNLSETDKKIFNCDVKCIDWEEFMMMWIIGCRKYIVKDGLKNTKAGVRKQKILRVVHYVVSTLYLYVLWKALSMLYYFCGTFF